MSELNVARPQAGLKKKKIIMLSQGHFPLENWPAALMFLLLTIFFSCQLAVEPQVVLDTEEEGSQILSTNTAEDLADPLDLESFLEIPTNRSNIPITASESSVKGRLPSESPTPSELQSASGSSSRSSSGTRTPSKTSAGSSTPSSVSQSINKRKRTTNTEEVDGQIISTEGYLQSVIVQYWESNDFAENFGKLLTYSLRLQAPSQKKKMARELYGVLRNYDLLFDDK